MPRQDDQKGRYLIDFCSASALSCPSAGTESTERELDSLLVPVVAPAADLAQGAPASVAQHSWAQKAVV